MIYLLTADGRKLLYDWYERVWVDRRGVKYDQTIYAYEVRAGESIALMAYGATRYRPSLNHPSTLIAAAWRVDPLPEPDYD